MSMHTQAVMSDAVGGRNGPDFGDGTLVSVHTGKTQAYGTAVARLKSSELAEAECPHNLRGRVLFNGYPEKPTRDKIAPSALLTQKPHNQPKPSGEMEGRNGSR